MAMVTLGYVLRWRTQERRGNASRQDSGSFRGCWKTPARSSLFLFDISMPRGDALCPL